MGLFRKSFIFKEDDYENEILQNTTSATTKVPSKFILLRSCSTKISALNITPYTVFIFTYIPVHGYVYGSHN